MTLSTVRDLFGNDVQPICSAHENGSQVILLKVPFSQLTNENMSPRKKSHDILQLPGQG